MIKFAIATKEYTNALLRGSVRTSDYDISGGMTSQPQNGLNEWVASPQFYTREDAMKVCKQMNEQSNPFAFHKVAEIETSHNITKEILETINKVIETGEITHPQLIDLIGLTGESANILKEKARGNFKEFEDFIAPYCAPLTKITGTVMKSKFGFAIKIKQKNKDISLVIGTKDISGDLKSQVVCKRAFNLKCDVELTGYLFNNRFFVVSAKEK